MFLFEYIIETKNLEKKVFVCPHKYSMLNHKNSQKPLVSPRFIQRKSLTGDVIQVENKRKLC